MAAGKNSKAALSISVYGCDKPIVNLWQLFVLAANANIAIDNI